MDLPTHLCLTLIAVAAIMACERRWPASDAESPIGVNLVAYAVVTAVQLRFLPLVQPPTDHALVRLADLPFPLGLLAFTLLMDFGEFAFHKAQHSHPWLWRMHALHHSDPNMNVATTVRHFWAEPLIKAATIWPLCAFLTSPTPEILAGYAVIGIYHFFVHSNVPISFGRWSWLLNSPAYHRRHHSARPEHFNSNYAGLFPIFDLLFGWYRRPDGFPRTGLAKAPRSVADVLVWPLRTSIR